MYWSKSPSWALSQWPCAAVRGVGETAGVMPVLGLRIVESQLDALLLAGRGQFLERIAMEGRGVDDVVRAGLGVEHGEAVVVLRGDDDVLHAGVLGDRHPLVGVELHRVELLGVAGVFGHGDLAVVHDPLADAADLLAVVGAGGHAVEAPVDEHAEAGLAPPLHAGVALGLGLGGRRRRSRRFARGELGSRQQHGCQNGGEDWSKKRDIVVFSTAGKIGGEM